MRSATATVVVPATRDDVFDYLSRIESVPEWATEFVEASKSRNPARPAPARGWGRCEVLEITPAAFRKRLSRARRRLHGFLRERCGRYETIAADGG